MRRALAAAVGWIVFAVIVLPGLVAFLLGREEIALYTQGEKPAADGPEIRVYLHEKDTVAVMALETYVEGVLRAEMPAAFEMEALKAQAVAARTYAVRQMRAYGGAGARGQPEADVSTDSAEDQAWLDDDACKARWGKAFDVYRKKTADAVRMTRGQIATYEGKPISAVFHSTSGGATASAEEVWGYDFPYLQSVSCEWDRDSPRYSETKQIPFEQLSAALGEDADAVTAVQSGASPAQVVATSASGRVKEARVGSKSFSGAELRQRLGLRSEKFTLQVQDGALAVHTLGYGHGVGLCQYGANGMAKAGKTYREILQHYYTGIEIKKMEALQGAM